MISHKVIDVSNGVFASHVVDQKGSGFPCFVDVFGVDFALISQVTNLLFRWHDG